MMSAADTGCASSAVFDLDLLARAHERFHQTALQRTRLLVPADAWSTGAVEVPACEDLTPYHSRILPQLPLWKLVTAVSPKLRLEPACIAVALVLAQRYNDRVRPVTAHMVHRLYAACLQVATKANSDVFCSNKSFAAVIGFQLGEMNRLEDTLLADLGWELFTSPADVERAVFNLPPCRSAITAAVSPASSSVRGCNASIGSISSEDEDVLAPIIRSLPSENALATHEVADD